MNDDPPPNSPADVGHGPAPVAPPKPPLKYSIPRGTPERTCTSCRARIFFVLTDKMRWTPVDADGTSHFATCPNAAQHRKR